MSESTTGAASTRVMVCGRIHGDILCHLEARLTLPSSTADLRDATCLGKCRNETFKLREQRDTFFIKAGQGARILLLCSLVYCKLSVQTAEVLCASVSPSL